MALEEQGEDVCNGCEKCDKISAALVVELVLPEVVLPGELGSTEVWGNDPQVLKYLSCAGQNNGETNDPEGGRGLTIIDSAELASVLEEDDGAADQFYLGAFPERISVLIAAIVRTTDCSIQDETLAKLDVRAAKALAGNPEYLGLDLPGAQEGLTLLVRE